MALVVGGPVAAERVLTLRVGGESVTVTAAPYDPVTDERYRMKLRDAAHQAEQVSELLPLLSPGAAEAIARLEPEAIEAAGVFWLAATLGADLIRDWDGFVDPDGAPAPFSPDHWQLACRTVPGLARAFLAAWMEPAIAEAAAGNA